MDVRFLFNEVLSRKIKYENGILQGSSHGPLLAIIYYQIALDLIAESKIGGINIRGRNIQKLAYCDDVILLATGEKERTCIM